MGQGSGAGGRQWEAGRPRPDCFGCAHFFVTWDREHPRGCKAFGFKGPRMPRDVVLASSGKECALYEPRADAKKT